MWGWFCIYNIFIISHKSFFLWVENPSYNFKEKTIGIECREKIERGAAVILKVRLVEYIHTHTLSAP